MIFTRTKFSLALFFLFSYNVCLAQSVSVAPIGNLSANGDTKWIQNYFNSRLQGIEVIGLGEFSHGTHEPLAFKAEMVRYLIKEKNFRCFFLELDDPALRDLNSFLQSTAPTNVPRIDTLFHMIAKDQIFNVSEIKDLLVWIKDFNLAHPNDMVSVRGMDIFISFFYFRDHYIDKVYYSKIQSDWKKKYKNRLVSSNEQYDIIHSWYKAKEKSLKETLGADEFTELRQDMDNFEKNATFYKNNSSQDSNMVRMRDSMMIQNIKRLKSGKTIIWAHNSHLANTGFNVGKFTAKNLGNSLREEYGAKYYILLTDYSSETPVNAMLGDRIKHKIDKNNSKSAAAILSKKYNVNSGILSISQFKEFGLPYIFNNISVEGRSFILNGNENSFNTLVIFDKLSASHLLN